MARVTVLLSSRVAQVAPLLEAWAAAGDQVTVVLLDAAVGIVRPGHAENVVLERLAKAGAIVLAHDDALRRRAVEAAAAGATAVDLDAIADLLTVDVDRAVWW